MELSAQTKFLHDYSNNNDEVDLKTLAKVKIKALIAEKLWPLEEIEDQVAKDFNVELSQLDKQFICKKYIKYCLKFWIEDTLKLCTNLKMDKFQQYLHALDRFKTLKEDVPTIFAFSKFLKLVYKIRHLITRQKDEEHVFEFKKELQHNLMKLNEGVKKELQFIQAFVTYIRSFKKLQILAIELKLYEFCSGSLSFDNFRNLLLQQGNLKGELGRTTFLRAQSLCNGAQFTQLNRLKKHIREFIRKPEINETQNGVCLEVMGMVIELEEIKPTIIQHINLNKNLKEVRLIVQDTLYLDANIDRQIFHGKNIVVYCRRLIVFKDEVKIDVSGKDCKTICKNDAGQSDDGRGKDGEDGQAGESGGNIIIIAYEEIVNGSNLSVISNGGNGCSGGNGGDGKTGDPGIGMTYTELLNTYNSPLNFSIPHDGTIIQRFIKRLKNSAELTIYKECENGSYYLEGKMSDGKEIIFNYNVWNRLFIYGSSCVFLCKGTHGKIGKAGGENGLGGDGGRSGDINIVCNSTDLSSIIKIAENGKEGLPGTSGCTGNPGSHGWDIGYQGYNTFNSTVYSGEEQNYLLTIKEYSVNGKDRSECKHKQNCFLKLEKKQALSKNIVQTKKQQRSTNRVQKSIQARAVQQKMVSMDAILSSYGEFMCNANQDSVDSTHLSAALESFLVKETDTQNIMNEVTAEELKLNIQSKYDSKFKASRKLFQVSTDHEEIRKIDTRLIDFQGNIKKPIVPNIKQLKMQRSELKDLAQLMSNSELWNEQKLNSQEKLIIENLVVSNYRRLALIKIEKHINKNITIKHDVNHLNKTRYLQTDSSQSSISDDDLHEIDQFILKDTKENRVRVVKFCSKLLQKNSKSIIKNALHIFFNDIKAGSINGKYTKIYESHSNLFKSFEVEKEMSIEICRCAFIELIKPHTKLFKRWNDYEMRQIKRKQFKKCMQNFMKSDSIALKSRNLVKKAYEKMHKEIDKTFNWKVCTADKKLMQLFYLNILQRGLYFDGYMQLLAEIFNVRIDLYLDKQGQIHWQDSFNIKESSRLLSILKDDLGSNSFLKVNNKFMKLENKRFAKGNLFNKVLYLIENASNKIAIDNAVRQFTKNRLPDVENKFSLQCYCEENDLQSILSNVKWDKSEMDLEKRLRTITSKFIPNNIIMHLLAQRLNYESCIISSKELLFLINRCLHSHIHGTQEMPYVHWIISTKLQENWTAELTLLHLENFYKTTLDPTSWRKLLYNVPNRDLLILFNNRLKNTSEKAAVPIQNLYEIFDLLSRLQGFPEELCESDLENWLHIIKSSILQLKLRNLFVGDTSEILQSATYYVHTLEHIHEQSLIMELLLAFKKRKTLLTCADILHSLTMFISGEWNLTKDVIEGLSSAHSRAEFDIWKKKLAKIMSDGNIRSMKQLIQIIKDSDTTLSSSIMDVLSLSHSVRMTGVKDDLLDFKEKVQSCKTLSSLKIPDQTDKTLKSIAKILLVIDQCVFLKRKFRLRDTQKLSVLILLGNAKSSLLQVSTGEGKSLIVVATAIIKALQGEKVDIITSSSVLAKRDALANKDIYDFFGVSVYHNCDENTQGRIKAYSSKQIIYGEISMFQRDYLVNRFYGKNILGDRTNFQNILVDEVDSMLLDKGNDILYLSHDLPWLDKLTPLYIFIWLWINEAGKEVENMNNDTNLGEFILNDLFGLIKKVDIEYLDSRLSSDEASTIWQLLVDENIIHADGTLKNYKNVNLDDMLGPKYDKISIRLKFKLLELQNREKTLCLPEYLLDFVKRHLDSWIKSARNVFFMKERDNYIVDVNRTQTNVEMSPNIIIIDKDTGMDQANSQWDEAHHQFLQLKHGCKLSAQSLKAVFISNVSYFKLYSNLYGLTGTLGSKTERELLKEIHEVDFITMPTAKSRKFTEQSPILSNDVLTWISNIKNEVLQVLGNKERPRSVLMICETVDKVDMLKKSLDNANIKIQTYTRDYEDFEFSEKSALDSGILLLSTNLAGRGTDIKISEKLLQNGGLHIILTFLPGNCRIEQQAFGRAARCGQPGTGRLIILNKYTECLSVLPLKRDRDNLELQRLSTFSKHYQMSIILQENCLNLFQSLYLQKKKNPFWKIVLADGQWSRLEEVESLVMQSLLDEWAYWLDSKSAEISNVRTESDFKSVLSSAKTFISTLQNQTSLNSMLKNNPSALIKMGKYCCAMDKLNDALNLFDQVIESEPNFSEAALYYKAFTVGKKNKWKANTEVTMLLEKARRHFEKHKNTCNTQAALVETLKSKTSSKLVQIDSFEIQQKTSVKVYEVFIDSIDKVLGYDVDASQFQTDKINLYTCEKLHSTMKKKGVLSWPRVKLTSKNEIILQEIAKSYGIDFMKLKNVLNKNKGVFDVEDFIQSFKALEYPSREDFWETLVHQSVLRDEFVFMEINKAEIKKHAQADLVEKLEGQSIHPETFKINDCKTLFELRDAELYYLIRISDMKNLFDDKEQEQHFISKQIMRKNRYAVFDTCLGSNVTLKKYASIVIKNITNLEIDESDATLILIELEQQGILKAKNDVYYPSSKAYADFSNVTLNIFPIYNYAIRSMLDYYMYYHNALSWLVKGTDVFIFDRIFSSYNTHTAIVVDLTNQNIITQSKVVFNECLGPEEENPSKFYRFLPSEMKNKEDAKHTSETLFNLRTVLKRFEFPQGNMQNVSDSFPKASYDTYILLNGFDLNGLDAIFTFSEKKWTTKMKLNTIAVITLGMIQLVVGVAIHYFSGGTMSRVSAMFYNEGFNDLSFAMSSLQSGYFSWAEYKKQKLISLLINILSYCFVSIVCRYAKVFRFGSNILKFFGLAKKGANVTSVGFKAVLKQQGKVLITRSIENIACGLVNIGVDSLTKYYLQNYCDILAEKLLKDMNQAIEVHNLNTLLERAYTVLGSSKALRVLGDLNEAFFEQRNVTNMYVTFCMSFYNQFESVLATATAKHYTNSSTKALLLSELISLIISMLRKSIKLYLFRDITNLVLDEMELKLRIEINKHIELSSNEIQESSNSSLESFKLEVTKMLKSSATEHVGNYINQEIVGYILKKLGSLAVDFAGIGLKKCYKWCKSSERREKQKVSNIENQSIEAKVTNDQKLPIDVEIIDMERENDELNSKNLKNTRDHTRFAEIIDSGSKMDTTCIIAGILILEDIAGSKYCVELHHEGNVYYIKSIHPSEKGRLKISLYLIEGHYYHQKGEKIDLGQGKRNDCLYNAFKPYLSKEITADIFRNMVSQKIRDSAEVRDFLQGGYHEKYINKGIIGGKEPRNLNDKNNNKNEKINDYFLYSCNDGKCKTCTRGIWVKKGSNHTCKTARVIYRCKCLHCGYEYIGSTQNPLKYRFYQHFRDVKNNKATAMAQHTDTHRSKDASIVNDFHKNFEIFIEEQVPLKNDIPLREQAKILSLNPKYTLNQRDEVRQEIPLKQRRKLQITADELRELQKNDVDPTSSIEKKKKKKKKGTKN